MRYTEDFKKQVVKKVLSPGVLQIEVCRKLKISVGAVIDWKRIYGVEMRKEIQEIDVGTLLYEEPVDIEELLRKADFHELKESNGSEALTLQIDQIRSAKKGASQYTDADKYAVVLSFRAIPGEQQGMFLRQLGLQSTHIKLWEEALITMSKKPIASDEYTKQLEAENKRLKKALTESERDNRELKILIELKKSTRIFSSRTRKKVRSGIQTRHCIPVPPSPA
jgi:transposase-like protein